VGLLGPRSAKVVCFFVTDLIIALVFTPDFTARHGIRRSADAGNPPPDDRAQQPVRHATFRWIPARTRVEVRYRAVVSHAEAIPESLT